MEQHRLVIGGTVVGYDEVRRSRMVVCAERIRVKIPRRETNFHCRSDFLHKLCNLDAVKIPEFEILALEVRRGGRVRLPAVLNHHTELTFVSGQKVATDGRAEAVRIIYRDRRYGE